MDLTSWHLERNGVESDLIDVCGARQREQCSTEYLDTLRMIAERDSRLQSGDVGVDISIPVRAVFSDDAMEENTTAGCAATDMLVAEKLIKQEWEDYESIPLAARSLRCTFVLEPMVHLSSRMNYFEAEAIVALIRGGVRFSSISLAMKSVIELRDAGITARTIFAQLMASLFDSTRRPPELAHTKYYVEDEVANQSPRLDPLQLGVVGVVCDESIHVSDFAAMCSAIILTQTTKMASIRVWMDHNDHVRNRRLWKWLAYAFFSKRARAHSSVESLSITSLGSMSVEDMEAFSAVVASDHLEEELFGYSRGLIDDRDATLKAGAPFRWLTANADRYVAPEVLSFEAPVRTFNDDGKSALVNIMLPGHGLCQVLRNDLYFCETIANDRQQSRLSSVTLKFDVDMLTVNESLPVFLAAVGESLKVFTLINTPAGLNENVILRGCPNLEELSVGYRECSLRLNLRDCCGRELNSRSGWNDVNAVLKELSDTNSLLTKCVRKLRVHLNVVNDEVMVSGALLSMLEANTNLEFLEIIVSPGHQIPLDKIKQHHHEHLRKAKKLLLIESKVAFLSVLLSRRSDEAHKKRKVSAPPSGHPLPELDQPVLSMIFFFAAEPAFRKLYVRKRDVDHDEEDDEDPM